MIQNGFDTNQMNIYQTQTDSSWTSEPMTSTSSYIESSTVLSSLLSTASTMPFSSVETTLTSELPAKQIRSGIRPNRTCGKSCRQVRLGQIKVTGQLPQEELF